MSAGNTVSTLIQIKGATCCLGVLSLQGSQNTEKKIRNRPAILIFEAPFSITHTLQQSFQTERWKLMQLSM